MTPLNNFINRYFGLILLSSALLGLFFRVGNVDTSLVIIFALGSVIFASYFRIDLNSDIFRNDLKSIPIYLLFRLLLLPVFVYYICISFSGFYATAFFLLLLLPSAVSSPAFSAMFGGSVSLALKVLVFSSFISIVSIPAMSHWVLARNVSIDSRHMFLIMVYTVVVPFIVHLPFRKSVRIRSVLTSNGPTITALGLMVIFVVSTSKNREIILSNPQKMFVYALISVVFYMVLYLIGYYLLFREERNKRLAYSVCSGANNIGIGVTITMLFFPEEMNVFFIVSQLAWIFVLIPMRWVYSKI